MLPPTVSTYSQRERYIPPPPDDKRLKKDLVEPLQVALHAIDNASATRGSVASKNEEEEATQGFYEIEGLHIPDTSTLAIRAARLY